MTIKGTQRSAGGNRQPAFAHNAITQHATVASAIGAPNGPTSNASVIPGTESATPHHAWKDLERRAYASGVRLDREWRLIGIAIK